MGHDDFDRLWTRLKNDLAFRIGTVYAGASWFIVEATDTLGASAALVRWIALALGAGFLVVVPAAWLADRRSVRLEESEMADGHWGIGFVPSRIRRSRAGTKRWATAVVVLVILAAGLWFGGTRVYGGAVPEAATRIAIVPFHATGSDAAREFGVGIVDLMSAALDNVGDIRTVSARTVLARSGAEPGVSPSIEEALEIGEDVRAGSVLTGSITSVAGRTVRLTAELRTVGDGVVLASASTEGAEDAILALTDELAVRLLRDMWRSADPLPTVSTAGLLTSSPSALREHLRGERFLRRMQFDSATAALRAATAADSTFALAWIRLAESTGWGRDQETLPARRTYAANAARYAARLPARERALVQAVQLRLDGDFDAADSLDAYVRRYSDDPYGWYLLGDTRFHTMHLGLNSDREIIDPFLEAARLDPSFSLGFRHAIDYAIDIGDREQFDVMMEMYEPAASPDEVANLRAQARVRWAPADSVLRAFLNEIRQRRSVEDRYFLNGAVGALGNRVRLDPTVDPMIYSQALDSSRVLFAGDRGWTRRAVELTAAHYLALGRGDRGFEAFDQLVALGGGPPVPASVASSLMRVIASAINDVPAERVRDDVVRVEAAAHMLPFLPTVLHVFYTQAGEFEKARQYPFNVQPPPDAPPIDTVGLKLALDGWVAALAGDTATALSQIEEGFRRLGTQDMFAMDPAVIVWAEILSRQPDRREQGIRMLRWFTIYRAGDTGRAYLSLGRALEAAGDATGAREAYGHVVRLWEGAEEYRQDEVQAARDALERLVREVG